MEATKSDADKGTGKGKGGKASVGFAFRLLAVTKALERIADHATNICEQVIYLRRGLIVRHRPEGWSEPAAPENGRAH